LIDDVFKGSLVVHDFMDRVKKIQASRPKFTVLVSFVSKSTGKGPSGEREQYDDENPLIILLTFMTERKLRLIDLFHSMDKDQSGSVDREEFIEALQVL
jgi:hypothetical protein